MDRPRIKIGVLHTIFPRVVVSLLVVSWFVVGCVAQPGTTNPAKPKPSTKRPAGTTLSAIAFDSFQARDRLRAEKLRALKGQGYKYDSKRMELIEQIGAEASRETWKPVAELLAKRMNSVSQTDEAAFDAVLEELAQGSERASK